jgi:hypothetical protein
MSAIFRTITLSWEGKTYEVKPTMALINKIEQRVSIAAILNGIREGQPQVSHVAVVLGEVFRAAGARVQDEELYLELMLGNSHEMVALSNLVFEALFPVPKKKEDSQNQLI